MSSGYFPLDKNYSKGAELASIKDQLEAIRVSYHDAICQDLTPEDAASDGGYLTYLSLAEELIQKCIR